MKRFALVALLVHCSSGADAMSDEEALQGIPPFHGDPANNAVFAVDVSVYETPLAQSQMDCFWDSGVRHVVVGTQDEGIARQQLAMAASRGMTVDAYVYLYWDTDPAAQVDQAFARVSGFPIGRMWLDVEQPTGNLGWKTVEGLVQKAADACSAKKTAGCGIYTGPGFWKTYMNDTTDLSSLPLWYALYNRKTSLSNWSTEHFGGWTKPVAKQWATQPLCGAGGADMDVMQVSTTPSVVVDRSPPPPSKQPPAVPSGLYPTGTVSLDYVKLMSGTVPGATQYQLALERWDGKNFAPYYTWTNPNAFVKAFPVRNFIYRFRARAMNAYGASAWSDWATLEYGHWAGARP